MSQEACEQLTVKRCVKFVFDANCSDLNVCDVNILLICSLDLLRKTQTDWRSIFILEWYITVSGTRGHSNNEHV